MYNNNVLPQTGAVSLGIFGMSMGNNIAIGISTIIIGIIIIKIIKFKTKESK